MRMGAFAGGLASGIASGYELAARAEKDKIANEKAGLEIAALRRNEDRTARDAADDEFVKSGMRDYFNNQVQPQQVYESADSSATVPAKTVDRNQAAIDAYRHGQELALKRGNFALADKMTERVAHGEALMSAERADKAIKALMSDDPEGAIEYLNAHPDGRKYSIAKIEGSDTGNPTYQFKSYDEKTGAERLLPAMSKSDLLRQAEGLRDPSKVLPMYMAAEKAKLDQRRLDTTERHQRVIEAQGDRRIELQDALNASIIGRNNSQAGLADARAAGGGGRSGGGSGGGDWKEKVQSTKTDANGHVFVVMKDGSTKYLQDPDGKRIKAKSSEGERLIGELTKIGARDVTTKDPVGRAKSMVRDIGLGDAVPAPAPAGAAKPVESFRQKFGY